MENDEEHRKVTVAMLLGTVPDYIQKVRCDTTKHTPPFKCAVSTCGNFFINFENHQLSPFKFHSFANYPNLAEKWRVQCGLPKGTPTDGMMVCSDHFSLDDYIRNYREEFSNPHFKRYLKNTAVPNQNRTNENTCMDILLSEPYLNNQNMELPMNVSEPLLNDQNRELPKRPSCKTEIDEEPSFGAIKEAVDENELLKEMLEMLEVRKTILKAKVDNLKMDINFKQNEISNMSKDKKYYVHMRNANKNLLRKVFSIAQIKLLMGHKRVHWSDDDMARAFTLRHIGSKECYLYIKNNLNFPLPSLESLQKWAASNY